MTDCTDEHGYVRELDNVVDTDCSLKRDKTNGWNRSILKKNKNYVLVDDLRSFLIEIHDQNKALWLYLTSSDIFTICITLYVLLVAETIKRLFSCVRYLSLKFDFFRMLEIDLRMNSSLPSVNQSIVSNQQRTQNMLCFLLLDRWCMIDTIFSHSSPIIRCHPSRMGSNNEVTSNICWKDRLIS